MKFRKLTVTLACVFIVTGCVASDPKKVTIYNGNKYELPDDLPQQPNDATIWRYYTNNDVHRARLSRNLIIEPSPNPYQFEKAIEKNSAVDRELSNSTILSYLYLDGESVIYDALPPKERFPAQLDDSSYFPSNSVGKSVVSYVLGHAICAGYISSVDEKISDWPMMEDTLYFGQPLINLLNMTAGDSHIIPPTRNNFVKSGRHFHDDAPLEYAAQNPFELKGTKPSSNPKYAYSNLASDVLINYVMHRVGYEYDDFLEEIFHSKIRNEHPIYFYTMRVYGASPEERRKNRIDKGAGTYMFWATRYDYLRIAQAMMKDWANDTCEGQYLKHLYQRRVTTNNPNVFKNTWSSNSLKWGNPYVVHLANSYAGQFWTGIKGFEGDTVLSMQGYNGQQVIMNMDKQRIVVINAAKAKHYSTRILGYQPIRFGRIR